jgi:DNA-binding NarL/FixJ family response regulator
MQQNLEFLDNLLCVEEQRPAVSSTKFTHSQSQRAKAVGYRPSAKHDEKVLEMHRDGLPYRLIGRNLGLSKNTVMKIIKRGSIEAVQ